MATWSSGRCNVSYAKQRFLLYERQMQRNKFFARVIDGTREEDGDHRLAVSTIPQPLGNGTTRSLRQRTASRANLHLFVSDTAVPSG